MIDIHMIAIHMIAIHMIAIHMIAIHMIAIHMIAIHMIAIHMIAIHMIAIHMIAIHMIAYIEVIWRTHYCTRHLQNELMKLEQSQAKNNLYKQITSINDAKSGTVKYRGNSRL